MNTSAPRSGFVAFRIPVLLLALGLAGTLISREEIIRAGETTATKFRPYTLRHARAGELEPILVGLLPSGTEVVADHRANRLLVRGTAESHQVALQAIRSLDHGQAGGGSPAAAQPADPVFRTYRCPAGQAPAIAAALEEELRNLPGARVVLDKRTSQILVIAPPEIQVQIADWIEDPFPTSPTRRQSSSAEWSNPSSPPPARTSARSPRPREIQLQQITAERLEATLIGVLGNRLSSAGSPSPDVVAYQLPAAGGTTLSLSINRRSHRVAVEGIGPVVESCVQLIRALDRSRQTDGQSISLIPLKAARLADVRKVTQAIHAGTSSGRMSNHAATSSPDNTLLLTRIFRQPEKTAPGQTKTAAPAAQPAGDAKVPGGAPPGEAAEEGGLLGPIEIRMLEGLDVLIIRGHRRDVEQVRKIIEQIEQISKETEPTIEVYHLLHVDCQALATMVEELYQEVFSLRQGDVSITPLVKPNALLLIGRDENVATVIDLVKRLDRPVSPETQFQVFRLKNAAAGDAQETIEEFFSDREGLGTKIQVIADFRSNSLIVEASPRDLAEVAALVDRLDTSDSEAVNELRVFKLSHSLAEDLASILQNAITGEGAPGQQAATEKSTMLRFVTIDPQGQRLLKSGILTDVRITADSRANVLLVSAPAESLPLIEALIKQLDQLPAAEALIKVFTIVNGDATSLIDMLEALFAQPTGADQPPVRTGAAEGESSLVQLRFAVDVRTNTITASGTTGDLSVVEAILLRLDEADVRARESTVYRLKNAPAEDVANAINDFLRSEREIQRIEPGLLSAFEQIEREVVVVAEPVSNALIVSATPRYFEEIEKIVEQLDERPPMVMIQVLIAEVQLNDTDEFGIELGLQDSIFFDRSLLGDLDTITNTVQTSTAAGVVTETEQIIQAATNTPGFLFNDTGPLGNSGSANAMQGAGIVGSQGLSNFAMGRFNSELGYGGLVLSASNEMVSVLIRALKEEQRLDVLSRPQIMTLDNQPAFIQVGERVPRIIGTDTTQVGQTNEITLENVGIILAVTPRVSPDGLVVMLIDADKSELGPEAEGIPVSISGGQTIRSPRITTTTAQTTVSAMDGQTVVLAGLISKNESQVSRRVPYLADIPLLGNLFRYDSIVTRRTELLIILTPHIVKSEEDAERIKQIEAARMHWCLSDVLELEDDPGLRSRADDWSDAETTTFYPDLDPSTETLPMLPQETPSAAGSPFRFEHSPTQPVEQAPTVAPLPDDMSRRRSPPADGVEHAAYAPYAENPQRRQNRESGVLPAYHSASQPETRQQPPPSVQYQYERYPSGDF